MSLKYLGLAFVVMDACMHMYMHVSPAPAECLGGPKHKYALLWTSRNFGETQKSPKNRKMTPKMSMHEHLVASKLSFDAYIRMCYVRSRCVRQCIHVPCSCASCNAMHRLRMKVFLYVNSHCSPTCRFSSVDVSASRFRNGSFHGSSCRCYK